MQRRVKSLQRIAVVYMAMKHAQALTLERAAVAVRDADSLIEQQRVEVRRSKTAGREALDAGEHVAWKMQESQREFTEWNAEVLIGLRERREALMAEAVAVYRAGRMQLEQMESVLRELRSKANLERERKDQRESDDRFLAQRWWQQRSSRYIDARGPDA